jgi:hypothetical protein
MYVTNGEGALAYHGGIDDQPTARLEDLKSPRNFVDQALSEISQGRCPSPPHASTAARSNMGRSEVGFCQNPSDRIGIDPPA